MVFCAGLSILAVLFKTAPNPLFVERHPVFDTNVNMVVK